MPSFSDSLGLGQAAILANFDHVQPPAAVGGGDNLYAPVKVHNMMLGYIVAQNQNSGERAEGNFFALAAWI